MKTKLPDHITNQQEAEAFIISLMDNGEDFHPEDSAFDVRNRDGSTYFTFEECNKIDELFEEAYDIDGFNAADFMWNELQKRNEQKAG